jgi:hypothetical protein
MANKRPSDLIAFLTLAGIVLLCLLGYWAFPHIQAWVAYQDCTGTGRTDCAAPR